MTPIQFVRDGVDTTVTEDTGVPANNRPLPVKLTGVTGDITITADNLDVQLEHNGANPDSIQIGDGTTILDVSVRDVAAGAADAGVQAMAVRSDAGGSLVGANGDITPLQTDANGNLRVTGGGGGTEFAEDSAHASGHLGTQLLAVRRDVAGSFCDTTGDYAPLQLDANGSLRVTGGAAGTEFAEDSASADGHLGTQVLTVRQDVLAVSTSTDGDYQPIKTNNEGSIYTNLSEPLPAGTNNIGDVDVLSLPSLPAGANNIGDVDVLSLPSLPAGANNIGDVDVLTAPGTFAEDSASADGHTGYSVLTVRQDVLAASTSTDGDYQPIKSNNEGSVYVNLSESLPAGTNNIGDVDVLSLPALPAGTNNIGDVDVLSLPALPAGTNNIGDVDVLTLPGTFAEDSAHSSGHTGMQMLAVRRDADTSLVDTTGDYAPLQVDANGALKVTSAGGGGITEFNEGSAYIASSAGNLGLGVRKDTAGALTGVANNDVTPLLVDSSGNLRTAIIAGTTAGATPNLIPVDKLDNSSWTTVNFSGSGIISSIGTTATGTSMITSTAAIIRKIRWQIKPTGTTYNVAELGIIFGSGTNIRYSDANYYGSLFFSYDTADGFGGPWSGELDVNIPSGINLRARLDSSQSAGAANYEIWFEFLG